MMRNTDMMLVWIIILITTMLRTNSKVDNCNVTSELVVFMWIEKDLDINNQTLKENHIEENMSRRT